MILRSEYALVDFITAHGYAEPQENQELSWCRFCRHWWHRRLSSRQPPVPPVKTKSASWQLLVVSETQKVKTTKNSTHRIIEHTGSLINRPWMEVWFKLLEFDFHRIPILFLTIFLGFARKLRFLLLLHDWTCWQPPHCRVSIPTIPQEKLWLWRSVLPRWHKLTHAKKP